MSDWLDHRLIHLSIKNLWTLKNHLSQMETHVEKWALTLHPEPILHLVQNIFIMDTDYVRHVLVLNRTRIILNVVELKKIKQNMVATSFTETSQNSTLTSLVHVDVVSLRSSCRTVYLFCKMLLSCLPSQLLTPTITCIQWKLGMTIKPVWMQ